MQIYLNECVIWVIFASYCIWCARVYSRKTSIIPEIRILAPSLERGLDDSWPLSIRSLDMPDLTNSPSLVHSPHIYHSHDDMSDSDSSRYLPRTYSDGTVTENHSQNCTRSVSIEHVHQIRWHPIAFLPPYSN